MRKIIVYVATSADGYIARPDGDVAWLDRPRPKGNYGMAAFYRSVDTILMGRKSYEVSLGFGWEPDPCKRNYVFSRKRRRRRAPGMEFVRGPVGEFAGRLRGEAGKDVWLLGGGEMIASFLDAGQVDEFRIHVVPVFIGEGVPLISPRHRLVPLKLLSARAYPDGVVRLRYSVARPAKDG
jgi:dihydrofolate reductase